MNNKMVFAGTATGIIGSAICAVAGMARVVGLYYVLGFQSTTLFSVGVGLMVFSCMIKLEELAENSRE